MRPSMWFGALGGLLALREASAAAASRHNTTISASGAADVYAQFPVCSKRCAESVLRDAGCSDDDASCPCREMLGQQMADCMNSACSKKDVLRTMNATDIACDIPQRNRPRALMTITSIVLGSVSLACIILRLLSRPPSPKRWTEMVDDWVLVANGFVIVVLTVLSVLLNDEGFGKDAHTLDLQQISIAQKLLYAQEITYIASVTLTRISILCFYLRVFPFVVLPVLERIIYVTLGVVTAAGISVAVALALQCTPVSYYWNWWKDDAEGHCIHLHGLGLAAGGIGIALDLWIMLIPLPEIRKLRLPLKQKLGLFLVFVAWAGVIVVTIPRMVYLRSFYESTNQTWHVFNATYWANIEAYTSVICACLPRVYSLFSKMYHQRFPSDAEHGRICPPQLAHLAATPRASVGRRSSIARAVGRERKSNI